jgi:hypothetical protein
VIHKLLSRTIVLSILVIAGGAAQAATVTHFKLTDHSLIGNWEGASDDGCFVSQTLITFAESVTHVDGAIIVGEPTTLVEVDYANSCTGEFLSLTGGTTNQTVSIGGDLSSASLSAVVTVTDGTSSADVTINATWTANGDLQNAKGHFRTTDGNTTTMDKFDDVVRPAATGGTITTTLPLAAGPTFVQLDRFPEGGTIGKDMNGERTVTKKH